MTRAEALERLRAHEAELKALGIEQLSLFGSVARGDQTDRSDVDLAAKLDYARCRGMFEFIDLNDRLSNLLGRKVDLVSEPTRRRRFQDQIDRDRIRVF
jgi:predicted nucleotidyltransferase